MPRRIVVDESGFIVSIDVVPERIPPRLQPKQSTVKKAKATASKKSMPGLQKNKTKTSPVTPTQVISAKSTANLVPCLVCNALVREERMSKHLRKAHPNVKADFSRMRPQQLKPETSSASGEVRMVLCSVCDALLKQDNWDKHVAKVHSVARSVSPRFPKSSEKSTEGIKSELKEIDRSLKQLAPGFHRLRIEELQNRRNVLLRKLQQPTQMSPKSTKKGAGNPGMYSEHQKEALRQSRSEEGSYGGKYLGHMRRDSDGRFGSLPLYDDYGEDSGPG